MADIDALETAGAAPDTPKSGTGELEQHGMAVRSLFPELWDTATSHETEKSSDDDDGDENDAMPSPETTTAYEEADATRRGWSPDNGLESAASNDSTSSNGSSNKVAQMRESFERTGKRSQLLNLNDFHMQQRAYRVDSLLKKGEAIKGLHSFRTLATAGDATSSSPPLPCKSLDEKAADRAAAAMYKGKMTRKDNNDNDEKESLKAADRAAMASYMLLRKSTGGSPQKNQPSSGTLAPHRTNYIGVRNADASSSSTSEKNTEIIPTGAAKKWRPSSNYLLGGIVTDVDEFYMQQHAQYVEDARKKREILHISDKTKLSPDKTSTPSPQYKTTIIQCQEDVALADSTDHEEKDEKSGAAASAALASDSMEDDGDVESKNNKGGEQNPLSAVNVVTEEQESNNASQVESSNTAQDVVLIPTIDACSDAGPIELKTKDGPSTIPDGADSSIVEDESHDGAIRTTAQGSLPTARALDQQLALRADVDLAVTEVDAAIDDNRPFKSEESTKNLVGQASTAPLVNPALESHNIQQNEDKSVNTQIENDDSIGNLHDSGLQESCVVDEADAVAGVVRLSVGDQNEDQDVSSSQPEEDFALTESLSAKTGELSVTPTTVDTESSGQTAYKAGGSEHEKKESIDHEAGLKPAKETSVCVALDNSPLESVQERPCEQDRAGASEDAQAAPQATDADNAVVMTTEDGNKGADLDIPGGITAELDVEEGSNQDHIHIVEQVASLLPTERDKTSACLDSVAARGERPLEGEEENNEFAALTVASVSSETSPAPTDVIPDRRKQDIKRNEGEDESSPYEKPSPEEEEPVVDGKPPDAITGEQGSEQDKSPEVKPFDQHEELGADEPVGRECPADGVAAEAEHWESPGAKNLLAGIEESLVASGDAEVAIVENDTDTTSLTKETTKIGEETELCATNSESDDVARESQLPPDNMDSCSADTDKVHVVTVNAIIVSEGDGFDPSDVKSSLEGVAAAVTQGTGEDSLVCSPTQSSASASIEPSHALDAEKCRAEVVAIAVLPDDVGVEEVPGRQSPEASQCDQDDQKGEAASCAKANTEEGDANNAIVSAEATLIQGDIANVSTSLPASDEPSSSIVHCVEDEHGKDQPQSVDYDGGLDEVNSLPSVTVSRSALHDDHAIEGHLDEGHTSNDQATDTDKPEESSALQKLSGAPVSICTDTDGEQVEEIVDAAKMPVGKAVATQEVAVMKPSGESDRSTVITRDDSIVTAVAHEKEIDKLFGREDNSLTPAAFAPSPITEVVALSSSPPYTFAEAADLNEPIHDPSAAEKEEAVVAEDAALPNEEASQRDAKENSAVSERPLAIDASKEKVVGVNDVNEVVEKSPVHAKDDIATKLDLAVATGPEGQATCELNVDTACWTPSGLAEDENHPDDILCNEETDPRVSAVETVISSEQRESERVEENVALPTFAAQPTNATSSSSEEPVVAANAIAVPHDASVQEGAKPAALSDPALDSGVDFADEASPAPTACAQSPGPSDSVANDQDEKSEVEVSTSAAEVTSSGQVDNAKEPKDALTSSTTRPKAEPLSPLPDALIEGAVLTENPEDVSGREETVAATTSVLPPTAMSEGSDVVNEADRHAAPKVLAKSGSQNDAVTAKQEDSPSLVELTSLVAGHVAESNQNDSVAEKEEPESTCPPIKAEDSSRSPDDLGAAVDSINNLGKSEVITNKATLELLEAKSKPALPPREGDVIVTSEEYIGKENKSPQDGEEIAVVTTSESSLESGMSTEQPCAVIAPSAGSTEEPVEADTAMAPKVKVDYKNEDYRGFVFVVHKQHGLMLLHCTRKPKKGPHFQLPGGHVDEPEFLAAAEASRDAQSQLLLASRAGAARELYEETGMDMRYKLDRLEPAALRNDVTFDKHGKPILQFELKHRLYFFLPVSDDDFYSVEKGDSESGMTHPMCDEGKNLMLRLSHEHSGWTFEKDPSKSIQKLAVHSGGNGATALRMSMGREGDKVMMMMMTTPVEADEVAIASPTKEESTTSVVNRDAPVDLLPPPPPSTGLTKLFTCCKWFD